MKVLGVDYGRRRIGMAISDSLGITVRPLSTLDRKHIDPLAALGSVVSQEHPDIIVFGLPLDHNDNETEMSREVRAFADRLGSQTDIPITFVDESGSSLRAQSLLQTRKKKARRTKANVDKIAACLILEQYLRETKA